MSYWWTGTTDIGVLAGRVAWLNGSSAQGGLASRVCAVADQRAPGHLVAGELGTADPQPGAEPLVVPLLAPSTCTPVDAGCAGDVLPYALAALPDGSFVVAGLAGNCANSRVAGVGYPGWVARYGPLCVPHGQ